jgi:fibronectin type 3 domain-containing protein
LGDVVEVTTLCETPAPTNIAATAVSSSSIAVSWDAVSGAVSYSVYRSSTVTGTYTLLGSTASNSFTDTGLSNLTTYFYKVTAKTALCDVSEQSEYGYAVTQ